MGDPRQINVSGIANMYGKTNLIRNRLRLTAAIDTISAGGRMMMKIVESFTELERAMVRERTRGGLDSSRKRRRIGGRRPKLMTNQKTEIVQLVDSGNKSAADAVRRFGVHPSTVSQLLQRAGKES